MASATKLKLYTQHSRHWQANRYVYPVVSRRSKGLSIGVNLNPDKICNFDCIYCSVDRTVPPPVREVDLNILKDELEDMLQRAASGQLFSESPFDQTPAHLRRINDVAFSGDGEPTSYPHFGDACKLAAELIDRIAPSAGIKIVVITNATLLQRPAVEQSLKYLDAHNGEIWAKLDAGTEPYYRLVERTSIPLSRVLANIIAAGSVRPIVIQSLFMNVHGEPPSHAELSAYIDRLQEIRAAGCQIKLVQIYTVARGPAESFVTPLPDASVDAIADRVKQIGLPVETYYGPN